MKFLLLSHKKNYGYSSSKKKCSYFARFGCHYFGIFGYDFIVQQKATAKFTLHFTSIDYAINSILFQRGIFPTKTFAHYEKYGVNILVSTDPYVQDKLKFDLKAIEGILLFNILAIVKIKCSTFWFLFLITGFMAKNWVRTVSLDIINSFSNELIESWDFDIKTDRSEYYNPNNRTSNKKLASIHKEIASIMRQILSTVSFLPRLNGCYSFNISVVFADGCTPRGWCPVEYFPIENPEKVELLPFSTGQHRVKTAVNFKPWTHAVFIFIRLYI